MSSYKWLRSYIIPIRKEAAVEATAIDAKARVRARGRPGLMVLGLGPPEHQR